MADQKISELASMTGAQIDPSTDLFAIVDTSANITKNATPDAVKTSLGLDTTETTANKSTSVTTDQASNTKYPSVKSVYDWVTGLGSGGSIGYQPIYSGKWRSFLFSGAATSLTGWNGLVIYVPYVINENHSVTDIGVFIATGVAASNIRLALYSDSNGAPNTLIEESGAIASTSSGVFLSYTFATPKSLTTSNKIAWMAIQTSASAIALSYTPNLISPYLDFSTGQISSRATQAQAFGAFPATATPSFGSPNAPVLCLKAS